MKKFLLAVLVGLVLGGCSFGGENEAGFDDSKPYVVVGDGENQQTFNVDVMKTDAERKKGLMFRDNLASYEGMVFLFEVPQKLGFWMKNMRFPLDIIFINSDHEIVNIATNVPPCVKDPCAVYESKENGQFVLEINAGAADRYGFKAGDKVEFKNFDLE